MKKAAGMTEATKEAGATKTTADRTGAKKEAQAKIKAIGEAAIKTEAKRKEGSELAKGPHPDWQRIQGRERFDGACW
eukprot:293199-Pelagomonas_calceolata.AAC.1